MSSLQWALLLLGAAVAAALIATSLRDKWKRARPVAKASPSVTGRDWGASSPADPVTPALPVAPGIAPALKPFDEFGVGKVRRRTAPELGVADPVPVVPGPAVPAVVPQLFGLYIAEYEGTNIMGPKIHAALAQSGLRFGHKKIYHRYDGDTVQFSVASLVKPGSLDPAEAEGFATPGLSVFMVLPGPGKPVEALNSMLDTARTLAKALNAELYDSQQRAPLTPSRELELRAQVEEWAKRQARVPASSGG